MGQLEGKIAIITGASSGIGRGTAEAFAAEGATVVLAARRQESLEVIAGDLRSKGATVLPVSADVRSESQVAALFGRVMTSFGRLDILVNNAGVFEGAPLEEMTLESWQRVIDTDLTGPFLCSREAMKIMKRQRAGRIINIGSIAAQMPRPNAVAYSCAKLALVALTKTTALEGRPFGVVASILHPGNTKTEMGDTDDEPMITVADLAKALVTMASLPLTVNMLETIVMPATQAYLGRG
jgi:NAD(P)-dependent dehydrogenase (short-subunit alcohol dehydrogenase family)